MDMKVLCECNSFNCGKSIMMSYEENLKNHQAGGLIIVEGCVTGPEATDVLVEERNGYTFYKEA